MAREVGIEPTTRGFGDPCSTIELLRQNGPDERTCTSTFTSLLHLKDFLGDILLIRHPGYVADRGKGKAKSLATSRRLGRPRTDTISLSAISLGDETSWVVLLVLGCPTQPCCSVEGGRVLPPPGSVGVSTSSGRTFYSIPTIVRPHRRPMRLENLFVFTPHIYIKHEARKSGLTKSKYFLLFC